MEVAEVQRHDQITRVEICGRELLGAVGWHVVAAMHEGAAAPRVHVVTHVPVTRPGTVHREDFRTSGIRGEASQDDLRRR